MGGITQKILENDQNTNRRIRKITKSTRQWEIPGKKVDKNQERVTTRIYLFRSSVLLSGSVNCNVGEGDKCVEMGKLVKVLLQSLNLQILRLF